MRRLLSDINTRFGRCWNYQSILQVPQAHKNDVCTNIGYVMARQSFSFVCKSTSSNHHHYTDLSEGIRQVKRFFKYIPSSLWPKLNQFYHLSFIQYVELCTCVSAYQFFIIMRIWVHYFITVIKSDVWIISHWLRVGHDTIICVPYLAIFLWFFNKISLVLFHGNFHFSDSQWIHENIVNYKESLLCLYEVQWSLVE